MSVWRTGYLPVVRPMDVQVLRDLEQGELDLSLLPIEPLQKTLAWHDRNDGQQAHFFLRQVLSDAAARPGR